MSVFRLVVVFFIYYLHLMYIFFRWLNYNYYYYPKKLACFASFHHFLILLTGFLVFTINKTMDTKTKKVYWLKKKKLYTFAHSFYLPANVYFVFTQRNMKHMIIMCIVRISNFCQKHTFCHELQIFNWIHFLFIVLIIFADSFVHSASIRKTYIKTEKNHPKFQK